MGSLRLQLGPVLFLGRVVSRRDPVPLAFMYFIFLLQNYFVSVFFRLTRRVGGGGVSTSEARQEAR
jgi:hypothetical protein